MIYTYTHMYVLCITKLRRLKQFIRTVIILRCNVVWWHTMTWRRVQQYRLLWGEFTSHRYPPPPTPTPPPPLASHNTPHTHMYAGDLSADIVIVNLFSHINKSLHNSLSAYWQIHRRSYSSYNDKSLYNPKKCTSDICHPSNSYIQIDAITYECLNLSSCLFVMGVIGKIWCQLEYDNFRTLFLAANPSFSQTWVWLIFYWIFFVGSITMTS